MAVPAIADLPRYVWFVDCWLRSYHLTEKPMAGDCPLTVKMIPAAPPVPPDAPADPVKAEMLAALKRLSGIIRDRHQLHRENIGYALPSLKDAEALIARAEGRA